MPRRLRALPKLDRRATFRAVLPSGDAAVAEAGWFGPPEAEEWSRWAEVRDATGAERIASGGEVAALQARFLVRADARTEGLLPRSHTLTDRRGTWDIVSISRSALRGAYLELLCTLRD